MNCELVYKCNDTNHVHIRNDAVQHYVAVPTSHTKAQQQQQHSKKKSSMTELCIHMLALSQTKRKYAKDAYESVISFMIY